MVAPARGPRATPPRVYDNLVLYRGSCPPAAWPSFSPLCVLALLVPRVATVAWHDSRVNPSDGSNMTYQQPQQGDRAGARAGGPGRLAGKSLGLGGDRMCQGRELCSPGTFLRLHDLNPA